MGERYKPLEVANGFIQRDQNESGAGLSHMKLQKLVYCAHGWWLAVHPSGEPSIVNERPQAWQYGPVFNTLYHVLKPMGSQQFTDIVSLPLLRPLVISDDDSKANELLDGVWKRYRHLSAFQLSEMTHKKGTPWQKIAERHNYQMPMGCEIPDKDVQEEFLSLMGDMNISSEAVDIAGT